MNIIILLYFLLIGLGAAKACALFLGYTLKLPGASLGMELFLGFGLFPVIISWLGFLGVFHIPYSGIVSGAVLALLGTRQLFCMSVQSIPFLRPSKKNIQQALPFIFVAIMMLITAFSKTCYFAGGINNSDDMRALAMTAAFSANYLKPAFPLDPSVPVGYSYYLYETSAFFYMAVEGRAWASTAALAVNLFAIAFFYIAFWHAVRPYKEAAPHWAACAAMLFVTFFGLDIFFYYDKAIADHHLEWWSPLQVSQMATYFNWVYHYLLSSGFVLSGCYCFSMLCKTRQLQWLAAATLSFVLAPCFGAFTGVWAAPMGPLLVLLAFVRCWPDARSIFSKARGQLLISILLCVIAAIYVFIPQIFTFMARPTFVGLRISPQWWFSHGNLFPLKLTELEQNVRITFIEYGPLLFVGIFLIPVMFFMGIRQRAMPVIATGLMGVIGIVGLHFTTSAVDDWFWRGGNLYVTITSAVALAWGLTFLKRPMYIAIVAVLAMAGLVPGIINFMAEQGFRRETCAAPPVEAEAINQQIALHDVIVAGYANRVDVSTFFFAGRLPLINSGMFNHYSDSPDFLKDTLGWKTPFTPCTYTRFGESTPSGYYVIFSRNNKQRKHCPPGTR